MATLNFSEGLLINDCFVVGFFRSNLKLNTVQLTQYFPDKHLEGEYEFESLILSPNYNKGQFNLSLCKYLWYFRISDGCLKMLKL